MMRRALKLLRNPMMHGVPADHPDVFAKHRAVIDRKRLLSDAYARFYGEFVAAARRVPPGVCVEIGSGGGFLKRHLPTAIASDLAPRPHVDVAFSADTMPLANGSVAAFFLLDVFHHIARPERFLREVERCLKPGGVLVMVEPANTVWGRLVRKAFHHEPFDEAGGWGLEGTRGWADANLALPWIVFVRDRARLSQTVPRLVLVRYQPHTPFRFLLSGGISYRSLVPGACSPLVGLVERLVSPLNGVLGMHVTIELRKAAA